MKKIILLFFLGIFCIQVQASFFSKVIGGCLIGGGMISSHKAYEEYSQEKKQPHFVKDHTQYARFAKEKMLKLSEKIENKDNKWLSKNIESFGNSLEKIEKNNPQTIKYSGLTVALIVLGLFIL